MAIVFFSTTPKLASAVLVFVDDMRGGVSHDAMLHFVPSTC